MTSTPLAALAMRLEAALVVDDDLAKSAVEAINALCPESRADAATLDSVDQVMALIYQLQPGWNIVIHGTASAPNGHWRCTLRKSSRRDEDEYLGIGRGPTLPHALLAALFKLVAYQRGN